MTKKRIKTISTTNLTNGLTSTDIVKIIGACCKNGVNYFEFGNLKINLSEREDYSYSPWVSEGVKVVDNSPEIGDTEDTEVRDMVTEEEIEELKISNPLAYEEIMNNA